MPQARPFRLLVQDNLTETLSAITPANGYFHDLTDAVFRGRAVFGEGDPIPMVSILEDPRNLPPLDTPGDENPVTVGDWNLLLQGFVKDDPENPTDPAYYLMDEVKTALSRQRIRNNILGLGSEKPCVESMKIGSGVVRPADEVSAKAYFWLPITLRLVESADSTYR